MTSALEQEGDGDWMFVRSLAGPDAQKHSHRACPLPVAYCGAGALAASVGSMPYSVRAMNLLFLRSWAPSMQQGVPNHRKERGHKHVCCLCKGDEMNDAD